MRSLVAPESGRARRALLVLLPSVSPLLTFAAAATVVVGSVLPVAFLVATGVLVGSVPDAATGGFSSRAGRTLVASLVALALLTLAQQAVQQLRVVVVNSLGRRVTAHLQSRVMAATLAPAGIAHLEDPATLDRLGLAQGVGPTAGSGTGEVNAGSAVIGLAEQLGQRLQGLAVIAVVARFRWWAGLLLLGSGIVCLRLSRRTFLAYVQALTGKAAELRRSAYFRTLGLEADAAKEIRLFGLRTWIIGRFDRSWRSGMSDLWRRRRRQAALAAIPIALEPACYLAVLVPLARAAARGEIGLAELVTYAQAVLAASVFSWSGPEDLQVAYGAGSVPHALALEEELAGPGATGLRGTLPATGLPAREIRFEGVGFAYPGSGREVFSALDLVIPAGRSLAVVGRNGAGKTTLIKLLARLHDPATGRITVDGTDLRDLDPGGWQRRIAAIFQDFTRYQLPVSDNIGFGAVEHAADADALEAAARRAGVLELVERLPSGWGTILSRQYKGGADLSGGQWQRLALARTLFAVGAGAGVLVLDEPTANLDVRAEAELYDRFLELTSGITTVVISHRFSTVRRADLIAVLDGGVVVEQGTHDELAAAKGLYAEMFRLQSERFTADVGGRGGDEPA